MGVHVESVIVVVTVMAVVVIVVDGSESVESLINPPFNFHLGLNLGISDSRLDLSFDIDIDISIDIVIKVSLGDFQISISSDQLVDFFVTPKTVGSCWSALVWHVS